MYINVYIYITCFHVHYLDVFAPLQSVWVQHEVFLLPPCDETRSHLVTIALQNEVTRTSLL